MALAVGTVSVDGSGVASGSGLARALYDAERAMVPAAWVTSVGVPAAAAQFQLMATKATAIATAIVAAVSAADVRIPADALDAGMPPDEVILTGAVE